MSSNSFFHLKKIALAFFIIFQATQQLAFGQFNTNDQSWMKDYLNSIYAAEWSENDQIIRQAKVSENFNALLTAFRWRWEYMPVHHNEAYFKPYFLLLEKATAIKNAKEDGFWSTLAIIYMAEAYYNNGDHYKAFVTAKSALDFLDKLTIDERYPNEMMLLKGIYLYYLAHGAEQYPVLGGMMSWFYTGNKKLGLQYIERVAQSDNMVHIEAKVYWTHIMTKLEKKAESSLWASRAMYERFPANHKFAEVYIENLLLCGKYEQAPAINQQLKLQDFPYYRKKYHYFEAYVLEQQGQFAAALVQYQKALDWAQKDRGESPHIMSLTYAGMSRIYKRKGQMAEAENCTALSKKYRVYDYGLSSLG